MHYQQLTQGTEMQTHVTEKLLGDQRLLKFVDDGPEAVDVVLLRLLQLAQL